MAVCGAYVPQRDVTSQCLCVCISLAATCPVVTAPSTATARAPGAETIPSSPARSWWTASYCRCLSAWSLDLFSKKQTCFYLVQHMCGLTAERDVEGSVNRSFKMGFGSEILYILHGGILWVLSLAPLRSRPNSCCKSLNSQRWCVWV